MSTNFNDFYLTSERLEQLCMRLLLLCNIVLWCNPCYYHIIPIISHHQSTHTASFVLRLTLLAINIVLNIPFVSPFADIGNGLQTENKHDYC